MNVPFARAASEERAMGVAVRQAISDPAEVVARVAAARRELLLRAHRQRLRYEDLEDCYSQATLELVVRSRRSPFANPDHVKNALEQKFVSRINDRRRALAGRSGIEAAIANALPVDSASSAAPEVEDRGAAVERHVEMHADIRRLREVMAELTADQRLVLHSQVNLQMESQDFCERYEWSAEKFRKVAQRGRAKLRGLLDEYQSGERCRRLEPDLLALVVGSGTREQLARARSHVENCPGCARQVALRSRVGRGLPVVAPVPAAAALASRGTLGWIGGAIRRVLGAARAPAAGAGTGGVAGVAGGSTGALMLGKASVAALCIAGAAGGIAVCASGDARSQPPKSARSRVTAARASAAEATRIAPAAVLRGAHRLTPVEQIRREFASGARHAVIAPATSSPAAPAALQAQPAVVTRQESKEFGFER